MSHPRLPAGLYYHVGKNKRWYWKVYFQHASKKYYWRLGPVDRETAVKKTNLARNLAIREATGLGADEDERPADFAEFIEAYIEDLGGRKVGREGSVKTIAGRLRTFIPYFTGRRFETITAKELRSVRDKLLQTPTIREMRKGD